MPDSSTQNYVSQAISILREGSFAARFNLLCFPAIILLALVARLWTLPSEVAWYDEVITVGYLDEATFDAFWTKVQFDNPPVQQLYPMLEYYWARWIGSSETSLRLLSMIPMVLSLFWVKLIGERIISRQAGLLAAFLLATSHVHIYYSQEIRMYAFTLPFSILSFYSILRMLDTDLKRWWVINILLTILIVWTHMLGVFFLACEFVFIGLYYGREKVRLTGLWSALQVLAVATIIPWLLAADLELIEDQFVYLEMPTIFYKKWGVYNLSIQGLYQNWVSIFPVVASSSVTRTIWAIINYAMMLAYFSAFVVCTARQFSTPKKETIDNTITERNTILMILSISILPVFILFLFSSYWKPSFYPRYVLISLVGMVLVLAKSLDCISNQTVQRAVIGTIVGLSILQLSMYVLTPARRPWDTIYETIDSRPETDVRIHLYGGDDYIMAMEARYHLDTVITDFRPHEELQSLDDYLRTEYQEDVSPDMQRSDILIVFTPEAMGHIRRYFAAQNIEYNATLMRTRMPLYYVEILGMG